MLGELRRRLKRFAHVSGGLPAYHRLRNGDQLTVLTYHRVLPPDDPRWHDADPEWTLSVDELAASVAFARRHFNVISLEELLAARRTRAALPPRPALLTFDDGWADNEEHALPVLESAQVPAVIFVSGDAVDRRGMFWREALRSAFLGGRLGEDVWRALWNGTGAAAPARDPAALEALIKAMSALRRSERDALLAGWPRILDDGRQHMLTRDQLIRLRDRGVAIGAHGRTHEPMTACEDVDDELAQPRRYLEAILGEPVTTLAYPHGRFDSDVLARSLRAGYELVFTGVPELAPVIPTPFAIGRVPVRRGDMMDESGRFCAERLALHLFRRPRASAWA